MKILIIEDEAPAFRRLQKVLDEIDPALEIVEVIDSVEDAVKWLNHHVAPDLILMDIQLSDGISFEIFDKVKINKPVIFTTAFDEYMLRAFKVNSIDYLLKPIKKEELARSLDKYRSLKDAFAPPENDVDLNALIRKINIGDKKYKSRFLIRRGEQLISIETSEIAYFQAKKGLVYLCVFSGRKHLTDLTLDEILRQTDPEQFYRINRQFIISFKSISATHKYHKGKLLVELVLKTDEHLTVSAERASDFRNWLGS